MNTAFPFAVGTTLCDDDTTDYVFESSPVGFGPLPLEALDGQQVEVFVRYPDNTTSGYEPCFGVYTHSTRTVTRDVIGQSSAGDGVPVNWGSSAPKYIVMVASGSTLGNMARVFLNLPPWQDILFGMESQSNGAWANLYLTGNTLPANDMVLDWCPPAAGGSYAWRVTDPTEHDTNLPVDSTVYVGTPRMAENTSVWYETGSIGRSAAITLQMLTGRRIRTIFAATIGAAIDNATTGWWPYNASLTTGCAKIFKDAVVAALAQMTTDDPRQTATKLHLYGRVQGETDAVTGKASGTFGFMLCDYLEALEDSTRWGICNRDTRYLLWDIPRQMREDTTSALKFDGHRAAKALFGDRVQVVDTAGATTADGAGGHYDGASADMLGPRGIALLVTPSMASSAASPAFRLIKELTTLTATYIMDTSGSGAPTSGKFKFNSGLTTLRIYNTGQDAVNWKNTGLKNLQAGAVLKLTKSGEVGSNYKLVTLAGPPVFNTNDVEWPIATPVDLGTVPVAGNDTVITLLTGKLFDGVSFTAASDFAIQSSARIEGTEYPINDPSTPGANHTRTNHYLGVDELGKDTRTRHLIPFYSEKKTTTSAATTLMLVYGLEQEDNVAEYIDAIIVCKIPATHEYAKFRIEGIIRRSGTTLAFDTAATVTTLQDPDSLGAPAIATDNFFGTNALLGWKITHSGKAATTIHWVVKAHVTVIPTLP